MAHVVMQARADHATSRRRLPQLHRHAHWKGCVLTDLGTKIPCKGILHGSYRDRLGSFITATIDYLDGVLAMAHMGCLEDRSAILWID